MRTLFLGVFLLSIVLGLLFAVGRARYEQHAALRALRNQCRAVTTNRQKEPNQSLWRLLGDDWADTVGHLWLNHSIADECNLSALSALRDLSSLNAGNIFNPRIAPGTFAALNDLKYVFVIYEQEGVQEASIWCERLAEAPSLRRLQFIGLVISKGDLRELAQSDSLRSLELIQCAISPQAILDLRSFRNLRTLSVSGPLSDEVLAQVAQMWQLENLAFDGSELSDNGLESLKKCRSLESLTLFDRNLSPTAIESFQKARPDVRFTVSSGK